MSFGTHCDSRRGYDYPRAFLKLISFALLDKKNSSLSRKILVSERIKFANSEYLRNPNYPNMYIKTNLKLIRFLPSLPIICTIFSNIWGVKGSFFFLITGLDKILSASSFIITVLDIEELSTFGIFLAKLFHSAIAMSINSVTIWGKSLCFIFFF